MWSCDCGNHLFVTVCLPVLCMHKVKCMALVYNKIHVAFYFCANKTNRHKDSQVKLSSRRLKVDVGKYYFKDDSDETIELKIMQDELDNKGIPLSYMNRTSILYLLLHVCDRWRSIESYFC